MAFLSNNKIKVFPTAFRGQDASGHAIDPGSFLTTEENFVNIANKVTYLHKDYFYVDGNIAYIILGGYYFVANVSDIQALFTNPANGDEIWAGINVADFGSAYESTSVKTLTPNGGSAGETLDDSTNFKGLTFLGKNDSKDGFTYKLKLFKRVSNAWEIEESSQLNISTNQIENDNSSTPITKSFTTNALSASSISANSISASFIATNELVAYSNGIITQSIFGPSQMVIGTSGTLSLYAGSITLHTTELYVGYGDSHNIYFGSNLSDAGIALDSEYPGNNLIIYRGYQGGINLSAGGDITLNANKSVNLNPGSNYSIYLNAGKDFVHLVNDGPVGDLQTPIYLDATGRPSPISYKIGSGSKELSFSDSKFSGTAFGKANSNSEATSITSWNSCYNSNATLYMTYQRIGNILNIDLKLQKTSTTAFLYSEDDWIRISKAWLCYIIFGNYLTTPANSLKDTCVVSLLENNAYGYGEHFISYIDNNYIYICLTQKHNDTSSNDGICAHISLILN